MENAISDVILSGSTSDPVLRILIDLTLAAKFEEKPLFPNLTQEPILYRHFRRMVTSALDILKTTGDE